MEIRKTLGRFVSIFFIVALGVAFYSGIRSSEPSMRLSGDSYFDKLKLMDIKVMGTMGLTEDDIRAIQAVDGIEQVEGSYSKDVLCPVENAEKVVHMISMEKSFNKVQVSEGRLPEKAGECLIDEDFLGYGDYKIGDKITFRSGNDEDLKESLVTDTFTIVGFGNSPLYISFGRGNSTIGNGEVSGFVVVSKESFDMDVFTEAYVRVEDAGREIAYTDEFIELSDAAVAALEDIKEQRCSIRRQNIVDEASEEVTDAEETLAEESGKLEDARQELEDAKSTAAKELQAARKKLEDGEAQLASSRQQIKDGEAQLAEGKKQLAAQQSTLDSGRKDYESGLAEVKKNETNLDNAESEYLANYAQYMPLIISGKEEIAKRKEEIAQGKQTIEQYLAPIEEGLTQITQLESLNSGLIELEKGITDVANAIGAAEQSLLEKKPEYERISLIPEAERTEEEKQFLVDWENLKATKKGLEDAKAGLEAKQGELTVQMQAAGFATQAELDAYLKSEEFLDKKKELEATKAKLDTQYQEILNNEQELLKTEEGLLAKEQELLAAGQQIADGKSQLVEAKNQLAWAKAQIDDGQRQIDAAWATVREKEQTLEDGKNQLASGEQELKDGRSEYEQAVIDAAAQIADGEEQIADGEAKLTEAKQDIADAKAEIEKIENPKWYVQNREDALEEYKGYGENADRMRSIGRVFPVLFFLVAALISLTTMTRMVEEQRVQIGTMKALGYSKLLIAKKYIYYALLATFGGSVFGVLVGEKVFPFIIIYAYKIMYQHIPDILVPYHLEYAVQATALAVLCTLLATVLSCYKELASQPAELMRPPAPKQGKRILLERVKPVWKRLSFIWKSSIRNLIRYKKRFFMTVFGIGGCMALMLVGFGLKDCIFEIVEIQYEKIQFYDASVYFDDAITGEEREEILSYMKNQNAVSKYTQARMQKIKAKSDKAEESLYLTVPQNVEEFEKLVNFGSRTSDDVYSLEKDQVILTEKMSQLLDVKAGDKITIKDEDRGEREVTIGAVCENYIGHYLYITPELYEELFGAPARDNSLLYMMKEGQENQTEDVGEHLLNYDNVLNVSYTSSLEERMDDMLRSLNLVIVVLIISAGMLAFVVLYNLNNINITERKRELATIKVLGFYDIEVASYVYRENILLTLIGALAGMGLGKILLQFVVVTVEVNEAMFGRDIHWPSYVYSLLFTVGFSLFVNWVMFFKLRRIDMVESLKSVE